jgi:hypothetical protein
MPEAEAVFRQLRLPPAGASYSPWPQDTGEWCDRRLFLSSLRSRRRRGGAVCVVAWGVMRVLCARSSLVIFACNGVGAVCCVLGLDVRSLGREWGLWWGGGSHTVSTYLSVRL